MMARKLYDLFYSLGEKLKCKMQKSKILVLPHDIGKTLLRL